MIALVIGGASSGKSAFAEALACALPKPRLYLAAMRAGDDPETRARIARHRRQRAGKGFQTVELADSARPLRAIEGTVLLEDLSNFALNGLTEQLPGILACANAVVVANELGCDGGRYDGLTRGFIRDVGALACEVAAAADVVVEVVAGTPNVVKGAALLDALGERLAGAGPEGQRA